MDRRLGEFIQACTRVFQLCKAVGTFVLLIPNLFDIKKLFQARKLKALTKLLILIYSNVGQR